MLNQHDLPANFVTMAFLNGRGIGRLARTSSMVYRSTPSGVRPRVDAAAFRVLERTELIARCRRGLRRRDATSASSLAEQIQGASGSAQERAGACRWSRRRNDLSSGRACRRGSRTCRFRLSLDGPRRIARQSAWSRTICASPTVCGSSGIKNESLDVTFKYNPTIRAAGMTSWQPSAFDATAGAFVPNVAGRTGVARQGLDHLSAFMTRSAARWSSAGISSRRQDSWKRAEAGGG